MSMNLNRRKFSAAFLVTFLVPTASVTAEEFPIFESEAQDVPYKFRRRTVQYKGKEPAGTIIVDSGKRYLYLITGPGKAIRYGVGVGREGSDWSGTAVIGRKAKWPTWRPTSEQMARSKIYRQWVDGMPPGPRNPLGARALYLFQNGNDTLYRIHGTSEPSTIGKRVSSGCLRMLNAHVADLYDRVDTGTRVIVLGRDEKFALE